MCIWNKSQEEEYVVALPPGSVHMMCTLRTGGECGEGISVCKKRFFLHMVNMTEKTGFCTPFSFTF